MGGSKCVHTRATALEAITQRLSEWVTNGLILLQRHISNVSRSRHRHGVLRFCRSTFSYNDLCAYQSRQIVLRFTEPGTAPATPIICITMKHTKGKANPKASTATGERSFNLLKQIESSKRKTRRKKPHKRIRNIRSFGTRIDVYRNPAIFTPGRHR